MNYDNKYSVGDLVQVEDCDGWFTVVDVHIYVGIDAEGGSTDITYGVVHTEDEEYLDVDEEEITAVKGGGVSMGEIKLKSETKKGKVNELLDMLNNLTALNAVTCGAFEDEKQAVMTQLTALTAKG